MIGFIGGGNMAEALIRGIVHKSDFTSPNEILVSELKSDRRAYLEKTYGVKTTASNAKAALASTIIILAVKPQNIDQALDAIKDSVTKDKTVVSIAAGVRLSYLLLKLPTKKIIRVMPNTPALIQEGMSVMSMPACSDKLDVSQVMKILTSVGKVIVLPEEQMDAVTALSGSGPAFLALYAEAMIEKGIELGIEKEHASELIVQTLLGTARLLGTGISPERLRETVTSPGGTTEAGLKVFNEKEFKEIVKAAIEAAVKRSKELGERSS